MSDPNFFQYLLDVAQVQMLISDRFYAVRAPQGAQLPYVVWARSGLDRQAMYCGVNGVVVGEYTFSCYGITPDEANRVHIAIRYAMQDFSKSVCRWQCFTRTSPIIPAKSCIA